VSAARSIRSPLFSRLRANLRRWADAERIQHHEDKVLLVLTLVIGAIVGLVVVAFILLTETLGARMYPAGGAAWRRLVFPVTGALVSGALLSRYFPNARGSGIPQTKTALFIHGGLIRMRTVIGKFVCSCISLASGIALGREGPSVQVGSGIASSLGRQIGLGPATTRALVPIGASAALSAAFNTPIAAVLFSLEEVMGDMHAPVLGSIVLSSATSWMVLHLVLGDEPLFHVPAYQLVHPVELALYGMLGLVGGLVSVAFVKLLLWLRLRFRRLPARTEWIQPAAGGLLVGALGWFVPAVVGVGYDQVSHALNGQLALTIMALLVVLKLVATATCYASGNAGGIFGPSLFIGAMLGGAFGGAAHNLLPDYTGGIGAYALVGMGVAFAGIIRAPLTSVIMIFEVTRDYTIIVPLMVSNLVSYFISRRFQPEPIYEALLHQDGVYLPSGARDREEALAVGDAVSTPLPLAASDTVQSALASESDIAAWPVLDGRGLLLGMITRTQLEEACREGRSLSAVSTLVAPIVEDEMLTAETFPHVHADQPLDTAFRRMARSGLTTLPVVSRLNARELVGTLSMRDALASYGLETRRGVPLPRVDGEQKRPVAAVIGLLASVVALVALAGFLSFCFRKERTGRGEQHFARATELMQAGRLQEAVEQYRSALSISHSPEHRLALGLALQKGGLLDEAEIYLREVLHGDPTSGPANLGLARIASQRGNIEEAVSSYHMASGGSWPAQAQEHRIETHLELAEVLWKSGRSSQAQAEVLELQSEKLLDPAMRRRVGRLLLRYALPREAAATFRSLTGKDPGDAVAQAGLAEAAFALGDYATAADGFRTALRLNPADADVGSRLELTEQVLALDPTVRGRRAADRYARSVALVRATLGAAERCLAAGHRPFAGSGAPAAEAAHAALERSSRPRSYSDAAEDNLAIAESVWRERQACGPAGSRDEALALVMQRLER
jgi:chloride channel protein, CIC family